MVAGVVLAAGAATRFGGPKQRLLVGRCRRGASAGRRSTGSSSSPAPTPLETAAPVVRCPSWERGPGASACAAGWRALADGVEAAVVVARGRAGPRARALSTA